MVDYSVYDSQFKKVLIEITDKENLNRGFERRMLAYYTATMAPYIKSKLDDIAKMKLLIRIAGTLTEEEISQRVANLDNEEKKNGYISILQELVDAYEDEDFDEYEDIEINGNRFTYKKELDITPFEELFNKIGDDTKGNKWIVEIDSEGKVVLHE